MSHKNFSAYVESNKWKTSLAVTRRYDLPEWPAVNKEVDSINVKLSKICNRFSNASFTDLSNLSRSCDTKHGLHLNQLGKKFVSEQLV